MCSFSFRGLNVKERSTKYIIISEQLLLEIENKTAIMFPDVNENIYIQIDFKWFKFCRSEICKNWPKNLAKKETVPKAIAPKI